MNIKICSVCNEQFTSPYSWATMCKTCFIEDKKNEREQLVENVAYWQNRALKAETELSQKSSVPPDMLRKIIHLCHPDKHSNSDASNVATKFLLSIRN